MTEGKIYYYLKRLLIKRGWKLLAGEPPGGSNNIRRVEIRDNSWSGIGSKGSYKVDLIFLKKSTLLLIEIKPRYSQSDVDKLNMIVSERLEDLYDALEKRCGVERTEIGKIIKCLGVNVLNRSIPEDFLAFVVKDKNRVNIKSGGKYKSLGLLEN